MTAAEVNDTSPSNAGAVTDISSDSASDGDSEESGSDDEMAQAVALSLGTASAGSSAAMAAAAAVATTVSPASATARKGAVAVQDNRHRYQREQDVARTVHLSIETLQSSPSSSESTQLRGKRRRDSVAATVSDAGGFDAETGSDDAAVQIPKAVELSLDDTSSAPERYHHSRRLQDRGSVFQAHATACNDEDDARRFVAGAFGLVCSNQPRSITASYIMVAFKYVFLTLVLAIAVFRDQT